MFLEIFCENIHGLDFANIDRPQAKKQPFKERRKPNGYLRIYENKLEFISGDLLQRLVSMGFTEEELLNFTQ